MAVAPQSVMDEFWTTVLEFAETTTYRVGVTLLEQTGQVSAAEKSDGSLVTRADQWADQTLREAIAQAFPTHGVLSEEVEHIFPDTDWCWIIDPIDGTTNFTRGIPLWAISLGLLYRGTPVFGYVYLPTLQHGFYGYCYGSSGLEGPTGAFLNHQPIHTSAADPSSNQFFNLCARSTAVLQDSDPFPAKLRMLGVASYNVLTVAMGAALGGVEATPKIWDIAAVWAIVRAAGGVWIPLNGVEPFPLEVGHDYSKTAYPTLVVSRPEVVSVFQPRVQFLGSAR